MTALASTRGAQADDDLLCGLVDAVRRFVSELPSALARDREGTLGSDVLQRARDIGLYGLAIPESHGGAGLGLAGVATIVAEIARVDRSLATSIGLHNGLGTRALIELGSPDLANRYLQDLATGARIGAFGATEPGAGSDLSSIRTTVAREGGTLVLSGEKAYVTNAGLAGLFTVLARVQAPGTAASGTALVVVPREAEGLTLGAEEDKLGLRASSTRSVFLDRVRVPSDHLLGVTGGGVDDAHRSLEWGRTLLSAGCLGTARAALERALEHTDHRRQFRRTLRSFGAVRAHLAAMTVAVVAIEALLASVGADEARGVAIDTSSAGLKVLASELACDACDRAIQLHGALGYVEESGIALLLRDARVTRIFEGANEVLLARLGTTLLSRPRPTMHATSPRHVALEAVRARLEELVEDVRRSHGVGAITHQRLLASLARADTWLRAGDACVARGDGLGQECARVLAARAARFVEDAEHALPEERGDLAILDVLGDDGARVVRPHPRATRAHAASPS